MTYSDGVFTGHEFHAHLFGALGQLPQHPFAVAFPQTRGHVLTPRQGVTS